MRRTCAYFISILAVFLILPDQLRGQDTLYIPLKLNIGIEASGPAIYFISKQTLSSEGYVSYDLSEKTAVAFNAGYLDYDYSQYNYAFNSKGFFIKAGADLNILKPKKSLGKYWGGLSLRYGLTRFGWSVPEISQSNYWGDASYSIPYGTNWGHFLEASPGMKAELFRNFSIGWSINVRMLLHTGLRDGVKPIYIPGFGNSGKKFSTGFSYYLVWNIPYKKKRIIIKKEEPQETEDTEEQNLNPNQRTGTSNPGFRP
jgi:hypothetical protein